MGFGIIYAAESHSDLAKADTYANQRRDILCVGGGESGPVLLLCNQNHFLSPDVQIHFVVMFSLDFEKEAS